MISLRDFVEESNRIEGILRPPTVVEVAAHRLLLAQSVNLDRLRQFVATVAQAGLRERTGHDVRVGLHVPPPGGPVIVLQLEAMLDDLGERPETNPSPYQFHQAYEALHPFMDGNGRSGRVLWAWHMQAIGRNAFYRPFLHEWYYQSLSESQLRW